MILDGLLLFSGNSNGSSGGTSSTAYTDLPTSGTTFSGNVLDLGLLGLPVSTGASATGAGGGARDIGIGDSPAMKVMAEVIVAMDTLTSLQIAVQGTHDNGSGAPYATDWTTMALGPVVALANLQAGQRICEIDMPRPAPGEALPRFLRLAYIVVGSANVAGTLEATLVIDRDDQIVGAAGQYSGYQAGVVVAN